MGHQVQIRKIPNKKKSPFVGSGGFLFTWSDCREEVMVASKGSGPSFASPDQTLLKIFKNTSHAL